MECGNGGSNLSRQATSSDRLLSEACPKWHFGCRVHCKMSTLSCLLMSLWWWGHPQCVRQCALMRRVSTGNTSSMRGHPTTDLERLKSSMYEATLVGPLSCE